jgi:hypothetical protein
MLDWKRGEATSFSSCGADSEMSSGGGAEYRVRISAGGGMASSG